MTYTVFWFRYPHGIEGEAMDCNTKEFTDAEKAIQFLRGRLMRIKSLNWAGGYVQEDETGKELYSIDDEGCAEDFRS